MSNQSPKSVAPGQSEADLQQRLDAALRELETTKAMLRLAELRLNAALGMPADQLVRTLLDGGAQRGACNDSAALVRKDT